MIYHTITLSHCRRKHGDEPFVALLETSTFGWPRGGKESVGDNSIVLCENLSNSFPPPGEFQRYNHHFFWMSGFCIFFLRYILDIVLS